MKKLLFLIFGLFMLSSFVCATTTLEVGNKNGHAYKVLKVILDGKSRIVTSVVPNGAQPLSLKQLMEKVGGVHAINGAFFCPPEYTWCNGPSTDALRLSNGKLYSRFGRDIGEYKAVLGFDKNGVPMWVTPRTKYRANGQWHNDEFKGMTDGLMMPVLVENGANVGKYNPYMTSDPKQSKATNKTFICYTKDKKTVYMGYVDKITFADFGDYLVKTFNCYNAILLDNGRSKAMIYNKKYVVGPGRNIMDAYVVIENNSVENTQNNTQNNIQNNQSSSNLNEVVFALKNEYKKNANKNLKNNMYLVINGKKILPTGVTSLQVKGIKVNTPYFNTLPIFNKLDRLILKVLSKSKYTQDDVLNFFEHYNNFKFAVYYMKTKNYSIGKQYAKKYLTKMLAVLSK